MSDTGNGKIQANVYNFKIFPMNREWKNHLVNQFSFLKVNTSVFHVSNPDGLHYFRVGTQTKQNKSPHGHSIAHREIWKKEIFRINVLNLHFWQALFTFELSGPHLGLIPTFQIMGCSVLSQFPGRDLGVTFPQVFSISSPNSLPTSPASAHKKWIMERTCADLRSISAFAGANASFKVQSGATNVAGLCSWSSGL